MLSTSILEDKKTLNPINKITIAIMFHNLRDILTIERIITPPLILCLSQLGIDPNWVYPYFNFIIRLNSRLMFAIVRTVRLGGWYPEGLITLLKFGSIPTAATVKISWRT